MCSKNFKIQLAKIQKYPTPQNELCCNETLYKDFFCELHCCKSSNKVCIFFYITPPVKENQSLSQKPNCQKQNNCGITLSKLPLGIILMAQPMNTKAKRQQKCQGKKKRTERWLGARLGVCWVSQVSFNLRKKNDKVICHSNFLQNNFVKVIFCNW